MTKMPRFLVEELTSNDVELSSREIIKQAYAYARTMLLEIKELQGYVAWCDSPKHNQRYISLLPMADGEDIKDVYAAIIREIIKQRECNRYVFTSEIWAIHRPTDAKNLEEVEQEAKEVGRVSEQPDRQEKLMVVLEERDVEGMTSMVGNIYRDNEGNLTGVETDPDIDESLQFTGRFCNVFKD